MRPGDNRGCGNNSNSILSAIHRKQPGLKPANHGSHLVYASSPTGGTENASRWRKQDLQSWEKRWRSCGVPSNDRSVEGTGNTSTLSSLKRKTPTMQATRGSGHTSRSSVQVTSVLSHRRSPWYRPLANHCLIGQVVKASARKAEGPEFKSRLRTDLSGSSHNSDIKIGNPVATLPGAWRYRVSADWSAQCQYTAIQCQYTVTGWAESLICNFYLSVAARTPVWVDPSLRYTSMLLGRQATN